MADRIFSAIMLAIALTYTVIAFTAIKAPFQYDPLGPESWPQILGVTASLCLVAIFAKPDVQRFDANRATLIRIFALVALLLAYGWAFQPFGFVFSTWIFCTVLSIMLGAKPVSAVAFGGAAGIIGYLVCTILLDLNLPAGPLAAFL